MPLTPDVVATYDTNQSDPLPQELLDILAEALRESFFPTLSIERKSLTAVKDRPNGGTKVVTIGLWLGSNSFSDNELLGALAAVDLLTPGKTAALLVSSHAIQLVAEGAWAAQTKTIDRATLDDTIDVHLEGDVIVTRVTGNYDVPLLPDIRFSYTIRDQLLLAAQGSVPPLTTATSTNFDTGNAGLGLNALIIGLIRPIIAAILVLTADDIGQSHVPDTEGVGAQLASAWPPQILTSINPDRGLLGKITFSWSDLTVNENGVLTLGTYESVSRTPQVNILGPSSASIQEAVGDVRRTFRADPHDLRAPLTIHWGGAASGSELKTTALFSQTGAAKVRLTIRDTDALSASTEHTVTVTMIPLEPEQDPH
jgi:hypothetical protein